MNVLVAGAGQVGAHIAQRLSREGHAVTVIEKDAATEETLRGQVNASTIRGSAASSEVLERAGARSADLFIGVTNQDEVNLVSSMLAREYGARRIIARVKSMEYTTPEWHRNAARLGVDRLINPQQAAAEELCRIISYTSAAEAAEFAGGRVAFLGYRIGRTSPLRGITLSRLAGIRGIYRMLVTAISRGHETIIPRGDDKILEGDIVYFVCNKSDVPAIDYLFEFERQPSKTIFILGAQRTGELLASALSGLDMRVKLLEPDPGLCERLVEDLDRVMVLNTDGMDVETLQHEGVEGCDAFVAATENEESNILCSLLAKSYGARRAIAVVDRHELVTLAPSLGVDACVSPRLVTASSVLQYVRPSGVASLATIEHSNAEVLEVALTAGSHLLGKPLRALHVPEGAVIGIIVRGDDVLIPNGDDQFRAGDHVVIFTLPEAISRVERFFA